VDNATVMADILDILSERSETAHRKFVQINQLESLIRGEKNKH